MAVQTRILDGIEGITEAYFDGVDKLTVYYDDRHSFFEISTKVAGCLSDKGLQRSFEKIAYISVRLSLP